MSIAISTSSDTSLGSYSLLKAHIAEKMDRTDLTAQIPNFIRMAEFWLTDKIFHPQGETTATLLTTAATDYVALPTDFRQLRQAHVVADPIQYLQIVSPSTLREDWVSGTGSPQALAIVNGFVQIGPTPDAQYSISITYLGDFVPLSDSAPSNWLLQRRADIYVYASLMQAEAHIVNDERIPLWKAALDEALSDLNRAGNRYRMSGSPLRLRNPVCV